LDLKGREAQTKKEKGIRSLIIFRIRGPGPTGKSQLDHIKKESGPRVRRIGVYCPSKKWLEGGRRAEKTRWFWDYKGGVTILKTYEGQEEKKIMPRNPEGERSLFSQEAPHPNRGSEQRRAFWKAQPGTTGKETLVSTLRLTEN